MKKDVMKLLPHSNGFHKIKHTREIKIGAIIKAIVIFIGVILLLGFIYQQVVDNMELNELSSKNKYVKIDSKRYYFNSPGNESPTIILDSDIGFGLSEWSRVQEVINNKYEVRTFAYDRAGYGFSEYSGERTPEEQARLLRMILKKVALNGPYILVGEGYGSLTMCNFAMLYPDKVQGVILIDPINEEALSNKEYIAQFKNDEFSSKIRKIGSYLGYNDLLSKLEITSGYDVLSEYMNEEDLNNYNIFKNKKNFTSAYNMELENLTNQISKAQTTGMFNDIPMVIITNDNNSKDEQVQLSNLGSSNNTKILNVTNSNTGVISLESPEVVLEAVKFILDSIKIEE